MRADAVALLAEDDVGRIGGKLRRRRPGSEANWLGLLRAAIRAAPIRAIEVTPVRTVPVSQRQLMARWMGRLRLVVLAGR